MTKRPAARNIMTAPIETIAETATLEKAAAKMLSEGVSSLVVAPESEHEPFGIITSSDLVSAYAHGLPARTARVCDVMTSPLLLVTPYVPALYVARLMDRALVRHVAVFNGREVLGIISQRDVLKALMPENAGEAPAHRGRAAAEA